MIEFMREDRLLNRWDGRIEGRVILTIRQVSRTSIRTSLRESRERLLHSRYVEVLGNMRRPKSIVVNG